MRKIAIIGSFKQYFPVVQEAIEIFRTYNILVTTPIGTDIIEPGINFVRFENDLAEESDSIVQSITLQRIFDAGVVYVVAPDGYVGRTTCYEIGRIIQKQLPIYFSSNPNDLPITIPDSHILNPKEMVSILTSNDVTWPFFKKSCKYTTIENELIKEI